MMLEYFNSFVKAYQVARPQHPNLSYHSFILFLIPIDLFRKLKKYFLNKTFYFLMTKVKKKTLSIKESEMYIFLLFRNNLDRKFRYFAIILIA
jgi:hypothetical protein